MYIDSLIVLARPWSSLPIHIYVVRGSAVPCLGTVHMDVLFDVYVYYVCVPFRIDVV